MVGTILADVMVVVLVDLRVLVRLEVTVEILWSMRISDDHLVEPRRTHRTNRGGGDSNG